MAKLSLKLEDRKDIFLYMTRIENLFISEFLPDAPGEYVKVYLFGLMYAQYDQHIDSKKLAMNLGLSEMEVEEAWIYWESRGLIRLIKDKNDNNEELTRIEFVRQIEALYGKSPEPEGKPAASAASEAGAAASGDDETHPVFVSIDDMDFEQPLTDRLVDKRMRDIFVKYQNTTGRTVSRHETSKIEDAVKVYGIEPEIFDFAIDYCADLEKYSIEYIFKVALRWTEEGCRTIEEAKRLLDKHSRRNSWYSRVFKALGFNRLPAPADREIMDRWFDDLGCTIDEVLDACGAAAGLRDPNLRYVNKVIENRILEKGGVASQKGKGRAAQTACAASGQTGYAGAPAQPAAVSFEEGSPVSRKVLSDYYEHIRSEDEKILKARVREALQSIPGMKEAFEAENAVNAKLLSIKPGNESLDTRQRLRAERIAIEEQKKALLSENGYPTDFLKRRYRCEICRDSGYTDEGMICRCCRDRAAEAFRWYTEKNKGQAAEKKNKG